MTERLPNQRLTEMTLDINRILEGATAEIYSHNGGYNTALERDVSYLFGLRAGIQIALGKMEPKFDLSCYGLVDLTRRDQLMKLAGQRSVRSPKGDVKKGQRTERVEDMVSRLADGFERRDRFVIKTITEDLI